MYNRPARWTMAVATAALVALPLTASAQTPPPTTSQPPTTAQPPTSTQPPQQADSTIDAAAAKEHMSEARDTLSQLTSLPEAARLQGDARTQVSQLISSFNELITTQTDWRSSYAKVDANLTTLLGPDSPDAAPASAVTGAVGTSGTTPAITLDPAVRAKLVEFRTHLKAFERAAGSNAAGAMAPSAAPASTSNPANPTSPASPAMQPPPASVTGTSGTTPPSPTATMEPADQAKAADQANRADVEKHLDAITTILDASKTGTLTKAQTTELKKHVAELRQALNQSK